MIFTCLQQISQYFFHHQIIRCPIYLTHTACIQYEHSLDLRSWQSFLIWILKTNLTLSVSVSGAMVLIFFILKVNNIFALFRRTILAVAYRGFLAPVARSRFSPPFFFTQISKMEFSGNGCIKVYKGLHNPNTTLRAPTYITYLHFPSIGLHIHAH